MSTSTGVIFNDQMNDFSIPDAYDLGYQDLPPASANFPAAGKRPLSSMTPLITLQDGDLHYVLGASGGKSIISGVLQVFMNMFGNNEHVNQAISTARWSHTLYPNVLNVESNFPTEWVDPLEDKGHVVEFKPLASTIAAVQVIIIIMESLC
jgi:gamma-glutamyltranspeptidase/glutathione hydrolase/leukotriene-C4 hydrolase